MLVAAMLTLTAGPASAEGHHCCWWTPDYAYSGYWLYLDCLEDVGDGQWGDWYPEILWFEFEPYRPGGPQMF